MDNRLSGLNALAYSGVNATTPPQLVQNDSPPTGTDWRNFAIGTLWLVNNVSLAQPQQLWYLSSLAQTNANGPAKWIQIAPGGGGGGALIIATTNGNATPDAFDTINFPDTANITTFGVGNTMQAVLNDDVVISGSLSVTPFNGAQGVVQAGAAGLFSTTNGTDGQLLIATGNSLPTWNNITSMDGSVVISYPTPGNINLAATGEGGGVVTFHNDNDDDAIAIDGAITMAGGANILTAGSNPGPTGEVTINLDTSIYLPSTNATFGTKSGSTGMYAINGTRFMHAYGTGNTFLGTGAGNLTLTTASAMNNTGLGEVTLSALTTGNLNVATGGGALSFCTTGSNNSAFGGSALFSLLTGSNNSVLGIGAGFNYTGAESSNIMIGNRGVIAESNVIRIGTQGAGAGQQNKSFMAGVYGSTGAGTLGVALVDSNGQLGTGDGTVTTVPANGQVLIGATGGSVKWATLTADANITITNTANTITIASTGGGGGGGTNAFLYQQLTTYSAAGAILALSTAHGLTALFDRGAGAQIIGTTFTAQKTGIWYFSICTQNLAVLPSFNNPISIIISVVDTTAPGNTMKYTFGYNTISSRPVQDGRTLSTFAPMSSGATATFYITFDGVTSLTFTYNAAAATALVSTPATWVSGYFVSP